MYHYVNLKDKFKQKVIEVLLEIKKKRDADFDFKWKFDLRKYKSGITLEQVLQALKLLDLIKAGVIYNSYRDRFIISFGEQNQIGGSEVYWTMIKEDGVTPATHEDQTDDSLYLLFQILTENDQ